MAEEIEAGLSPSGDPRIRAVRRVTVGVLLLLVVVLAAGIATGAGVAAGFIGLVLVGCLVAALAIERALVARSAAVRSSREATLTAILRGLSRSVSPDAVVAAIVDELRRGVAADHVAIVRLKPAERVVEATLVSSGPAVPLSVTRFPATDLEDGAAGWDGWDRRTSADVAIAVDGDGPAGEGARVAATAEGLRDAEAAVAASGAVGLDGRRSRLARAADRGWRRHDGAPMVAVPVLAEMDEAAASEQGALEMARPLPRRGTATEVVAAEPPEEPTPTADPPAVRRPRGSFAAAGLEGFAAIRTSVALGTRRGAVRRAPTVVERLTDRVCRAYGLRHVVSAPLVVRSRVIGALVLSRRIDSEWPAESRELLESAAREVSAALERAYDHEEAKARAASDALTGLPNRAYFDELATLLGKGRRADDVLGVLMLDIDRFKALNDRYGHPTGDDVLRGVGRALRTCVRSEDVPARYGGEEFVVVLRHATDEQAVEVAERIRTAIHQLDGASLGLHHPVTVSVGVAVGRSSPAELVERADAALYRAKRRGRDRVEVG